MVDRADLVAGPEHHGADLGPVRLHRGAVVRVRRLPEGLPDWRGVGPSRDCSVPITRRPGGNGPAHGLAVPQRAGDGAAADAGGAALGDLSVVQGRQRGAVGCAGARVDGLRHRQRRRGKGRRPVDIPPRGRQRPQPGQLPADRAVPRHPGDARLVHREGQVVVAARRLGRRRPLPPGQVVAGLDPRVRPLGREPVRGGPWRAGLSGPGRAGQEGTGTRGAHPRHEQPPRRPTRTAP